MLCKTIFILTIFHNSNQETGNKKQNTFIKINVCWNFYTTQKKFQLNNLFLHFPFLSYTVIEMLCKWTIETGLTLVKVDRTIFVLIPIVIK